MNDSDPEALPANWRVTSVTPPSHGTASINTPGNVSVFYNPAANYVGLDSFAYTMSDGDGGSATATVNVTVNEADDTPIATDDPNSGFLLVGEGQTLVINVLANDMGLGDEPLTVAVTAGPTFPGCAASGAAVVTGSPGPASGIRIEYTAPTDECTGAVTFDVHRHRWRHPHSTRFRQRHGVSACHPVNDPPVAVDDDGGSTDEDTSTVIDVAANDFDVETTVVPASVAIVSCPGGASCAANGDGTVTFTPGANFYGVASLTYTIDDDQGATSNPGTATVVVNSVNDPPTAVDDSRSTNQGVPVTINAVGNDYDIDGSVVASTATVVGGPANGTVINNGDGTFTYTPNVAPFASDSFTYQVWDNDGAPSNVATVTIGINQPDLTVNKDAIPDSAAPGEEVQFFISIINNGPGTAFSVSVSDDLGRLLPLGRVAQLWLPRGLGPGRGAGARAEGSGRCRALPELRQHQPGGSHGGQRFQLRRHRYREHPDAADDALLHDDARGIDTARLADADRDRGADHHCGGQRHTDNGSRRSDLDREPGGQRDLHGCRARRDTFGLGGAAHSRRHGHRRGDAGRDQRTDRSADRSCRRRLSRLSCRRRRPRLHPSPASRRRLPQSRQGPFQSLQRSHLPAKNHLSFRLAEGESPRPNHSAARRHLPCPQAGGKSPRPNPWRRS